MAFLTFDCTCNRQFLFALLKYRARYSGPRPLHHFATYVGNATDPAKYYYFYIYWADERHRFSTSIWRMLTPLGSYRHRGNDWFDEGSTFSQAVASNRHPANWDYGVAIKCCWGVILLRLIESQGENQFDVFLYEGKFH